MNYIREKISDGIYFNSIATPKFKTDSIDISFTLPLCEKAPLYTLSRCVLLRGCDSYPTKRLLDRRLDFLYDTSINVYINKSGDCMTVGFELYSLKNSFTYSGEDVLSDALGVLLQVMLSPLLRDGAFLPEYVEGEKKMQSDAIRAEINEKGRYTVKKCTEKMCEGEPFAISCLGDVALVQAITPAELYEAYRDMLARASVEVMYIGTDTDRARVFANTLADRLLAERRPVSLPVPVDRSVGEVRRFDEDAPVSQSKLAMGFRTHCAITDESYRAYPLFNELFSSSPVSRLFMNVREKLSLCYYCSSSVSARNGVMIVSSGLEEQNIPRAEEEILAQLSSVARGEFTREELDNCKKGLISAMRECDDSQPALTRRFAATLGTPTPFDTALAAERIRTVTADEVAECAGRIELDTVFALRGNAEKG